MGIANLSSFRKDKRKEIEPSIDYLKNILNDITEMEANVRKQVVNLSTSNDAPAKVARDVVENPSLPRSKQMQRVHVSMYKYNDLANKVNLSIVPVVTEMYGDAQSVVNNTKLELMNDPLFNRLTSSNAEREREVSFILMYLQTVFNKIEMKFKNIKNYIKHIDDQAHYLSKLDSMIRLQQKIAESADYEAMMGGTIQEADI